VGRIHGNQMVGHQALKELTTLSSDQEQM